MIIESGRLFLLWLAIALCYLLVKLIWVGAGYLHTGAILHGAVPAVLMIAFGLWFRGHAPSGALWLMILPALVLLITPSFMFWKQGAEAWLTEGRGSVLAIYEMLALVQIWAGWRLRGIL